MRQVVMILMLVLVGCASMSDDRQEVLTVVNAVVSGLAHMDAEAIASNFADDLHASNIRL